MIRALLIVLALASLAWAGPLRTAVKIVGNTTNATYVLADAKKTTIMAYPCNASGYTEAAVKGYLTVYHRMNATTNIARFGNEYVAVRAGNMSMTAPNVFTLTAPYESIKIMPTTVNTSHYKLYITQSE